jgi:hypothetical protein
MTKDRQASLASPSNATCENSACRPSGSPAKPRPHPPQATEHGHSFHRLVQWRTGSEGRISYLKRTCGWDRTLLDGRNGATIWCGHGYSPITWSSSEP